MYTVSNGEGIATAQDTSSTCWLACYKMMFKWKGIPSEGLDKIVENAGIAMYAADGHGAKETGLKLKDFPTAHGSLGMNSLTGGPFDEEELDYILRKRGPIWTVTRWGGGNHNVVVIGAGEGKIKYVNPWWEVQKKADIITCQLSIFNSMLNYFKGWKGAKAAFP